MHDVQLYRTNNCANVNAMVASEDIVRWNVGYVFRSDNVGSVAEYDISGILTFSAKEARTWASLENAGPTTPTVFEVDILSHVLLRAWIASPFVNANRHPMNWLSTTVWYRRESIIADRNIARQWMVDKSDWDSVMSKSFSNKPNNCTPEEFEIGQADSICCIWHCRHRKRSKIHGDRVHLNTRYISKPWMTQTKEVMLYLQWKNSVRAFISVQRRLHLRTLFQIQSSRSIGFTNINSLLTTKFLQTLTTVPYEYMSEMYYRWIKTWIYITSFPRDGKKGCNVYLYGYRDRAVRMRVLSGRVTERSGFARFNSISKPLLNGITGQPIPNQKRFKTETLPSVLEPKRLHIVPNLMVCCYSSSLVETLAVQFGGILTFTWAIFYIYQAK